MLLTSLILAAIAVALAWPVPVMLAKARWTAATPAAGLVLWQLVALAGGLSMIGSLVAFGLVPFGGTDGGGPVLLGRILMPGTTEAANSGHVVALCCAVALGAYLLLKLVITGFRTAAQRRRHRRLVELLGSPIPGRPGTRLIDHESPVAYCLPGATRSITVLSAGLLRLLDEKELHAVIEHEKAHLAQRHDLVLMAFDAWRESLPWLPVASYAHQAVGTLVEMLADDCARRQVDDQTLAAAIVLVARGAEPPAAPQGQQHPDVSTVITARVERLLDRTRQAAGTLPG